MRVFPCFFIIVMTPHSLYPLAQLFTTLFSAAAANEYTQKEAETFEWQKLLLKISKLLIIFPCFLLLIPLRRRFFVYLMVRKFLWLRCLSPPSVNITAARMTLDVAWMRKFSASSGGSIDAPLMKISPLLLPCLMLLIHLHIS